MRLFVAIEIPEDIKKAIAETQGKLKMCGLDAGWTRPEGIHLTLKFLGEVQESKVPEIMSALSDAAKGMNSFRLEVAGAGAFPHARHPRVIWLGVAGGIEQLAKLQTAVEDAMAKAGFEREDRKFSPHLTLARIKFPRAKDNWQQALESVKDIKLSGFDVNTVSLMKSELKSSGAVYTEVGAVELT